MLTQPSSLCAFKLTIAATAVKTISALLIIPIIYIGWLAIALGIADGHAYDAKQLEKQWKKQDNFSQAVLADAITLSEAAVHWAPDHPDYLDQLSRYLTLRYLIDKDQGTAERVRRSYCMPEPSAQAGRATGPLTLISNTIQVRPTRTWAMR